LRERRCACCAATLLSSSCAGEASFIRPLSAAPSAMMGFSSSSGLASPRLPPIEKAAKSSYASPRSFGPARDAAVRRLQTLNLTPRVGGAGGRIGLVPTPGALAKLPGLTPAPRRAAFTQTFNGGPARLPPPLGPPPSEELLEARRARAREKKREQAEDAERRAVELRAEKLEAREQRDPNLTRGACRLCAGTLRRCTTLNPPTRSADRRRQLKRHRAAVLIQSRVRVFLSRNTIRAQANPDRRLEPG